MRWSHLLLVVVWLCAAGTAAAQAVPIIEAGREAEVQALFAPHSLGQDVEGWRFQSLQIEPQEIRAGVRATHDEGGELREVRLVYRGSVEGAPAASTASFDAHFVDDPGEARGALRALLAAVAENDAGGFWLSEAPPRPFTVAAPDRAWTQDGLLWCGLLLVWLVALVYRSSGTRGQSSPHGLDKFGWAALLLLVAAAALLRVAMAPDALLGAWPYGRTTDLQRWVFTGPLLRALSHWVGPLRETVVMRSIGLGFSLVTPLAVFAHGSWLLGTARRGLLAALVVAALPLHIRFSRSEVAFIPSIVLSSALFASIHLALKDERRWWRAAAGVALVPLTVAMMSARPLNVLFLLLAVVVIAAARSASRARRALVAALVMLPGALMTVTHLLAYYGENVREAASAPIFRDAWRLLIDPERNTLISPSTSPPIVGLAALFATFAIARRASREQRLRLAFLWAWLALFFVTHAYVVPDAPLAQARYHLHLVVPLAFLAALGFDRVLALPKQRALHRFGAPLALIALVISPLVHSSFIRDVDFNDAIEHRFAEAVRPQIPEGCSVVEFGGPGDAMDARMRRVGLAVVDGTAHQRFRVSTSLPEPRPDCLYYYEGLPCFAFKSREQPIAPECASLRRAARWQPVATRRFTSRIYDGNLARGIGREPLPIAITLYRAR